MQFSLWQVAVLAVVQGVTEFLPISSDGHLAVVKPFLFSSNNVPVDSMDLTIVLHLGTLGSILVYYRERIARLLTDDRWVLYLLVIGTLPAVVVVLTCKAISNRFEETLQSPLLAGFMFPVTGIALLWAMSRPPGGREYRELTTVDSLVIGICQAAAILPGLSRSGTTISSALGLGVSRAQAAVFSFLLAIPALAGAGVYKGLSMLHEPQPLSASVHSLVIGAVIAFFVGLGAIWSVERLLTQGRLQWCAWYCIALGAIVVVWQLAALR
jgi:undecaprenyl-diphosphatase